MSANRLYDLLEVPPTASPEEIRSSYRRLALRCHPDKAGPSAAAQFIEIQHAYEVLSDPQTRKIYDRYGERGLEMATSAVGTAALSAFHLKTLLMTLSLMSFACVFMVLLFLIFLVCKLDRVGDIGDSWSWPQVFGPLFALAGITTISLCCFTPAVVATLKSGSAGGGVLLVALRMVLLYLTGFSFTAFVILVAVGLEQQRSDNDVICWRLYLIPFYILAALHFLSACFGARLKDLRERFARAGIGEASTWWLVGYAALDVVQGVCSVTFAALLACRVDQVITINWFLVALPLFVSYVASYGQRVLEASAKSDLLGCCGVVGLLFQQLIAIGLPAATTVMICALLEQSPDTSLTVAKCLSPMFAVFGALVLFSCCGCCLTCCTPSEMFDPTGTDAAEHQQSRREQQQQQHDEEEGRRGQEGVVDGPQHATTTTAEPPGEHPTTNEPLAERQTADIDD